MGELKIGWGGWGRGKWRKISEQQGGFRTGVPVFPVGVAQACNREELETNIREG